MLLESIKTKKSKFRLSLLFLLYFFAFSHTDVCNAVDKNDPAVNFLMSVKDLSAKYIQEEFDGKKNIKTTGEIAVKKPDNIMLTYKSDKMNLKFVSVNGNVKVIDQDLKQTTYVDNKYSDLMQFFTNNLKPEKMTKIGNNILCMPFENFGNNFEACLYVDFDKKTFNEIVVFIEDAEKKQNKKDVNKKKKQDKMQKMYPVMSITFKDLKINKGVSEGIFEVKDNRIFDDEEEF